MALAKLTRHYLHGKPPYTSIYKWELETVQNHSKFNYNAHIYNTHCRHPSCLAEVQWIPLSYVSILSQPEEKPDMAMKTANCSPPFLPSTWKIPLQIVKIFIYLFIFFPPASSWKRVQRLLFLVILFNCLQITAMNYCFLPIQSILHYILEACMYVSG